MALTKTQTPSAQDWTAVAQNTIAESAEVDVSASYEALLHIQAALDSTTAHTGTRFIIQVSGSTSGDEDWYDLLEFVELVGTANSEAITNNPLDAAAVTITCASTTGYTNGIWVLIEDATLINSELVRQIAVSANVSITILDGTTNQHAQNTTMYNIAFSRSGIGLPLSAYRARLIVDNTFDSDGSTLNYKVGVTKVTGI